MSSKRWLHVVATITLIHLGVIGVLWRQGALQPPNWMSAQLVALNQEVQSADALAEPVSTSAAVKSARVAASDAPVFSTASMQKNAPTSELQARDGSQLARSSAPSNTQTPSANAHQNTANVSPKTSGTNSDGGAASHTASDTAHDAGALTLPTHIGGHLHNPQPPYPEFSRDAGEQGVVTLSVMVEPNGRASSVDVVKGSGYARLDRSAYDTVLNQYRFTPATRGGQPIAYRYRFSVVFKLHKSS